VVPAFDDFGRLPLGEHTATWEEIVEPFGWNPHGAGCSMDLPMDWRRLRRRGAGKFG
jgi:hypothetical protein